ncbi:MAG: D-sedoheptulose 7-phosphate isomerase [Lentimicrobiaceae bacterium]|nr:D-sedoheptulose 7-phosphate isomerase [Lentimicrobiaceae bacterium]
MQISHIIRESIQVKEQILQDPQLLGTIEEVASLCTEALRGGGKILFCGNGGSAADAQHLAAELSGRFYYDRPPLPAEALHVNTSYLTAVANDYSFDEVFSRLLKGSARKGDVLIALSSSGNSRNVIHALHTARESGIITVGLTGASGGKMRPLCDHLIHVPSSDTPRIQEAHILIGHIICQWVESTLFPR